MKGLSLGGVPYVLQGVIHKDLLTEGRFADIFAYHMKQYLNVKYVSLCNSGSSANLLAMIAAGVTKESVVMTPALAFPTTINPILLLGATAYFIDVDRETMLPSIDIIEAAWHENVTHLMLTHHLGNCLQIDEIKAFCYDKGIKLIEDCCDAFGSTYHGIKVGTTSTAGTFSFYPAHHIVMGEGGAVVTNDVEVYKKVESVKSWGRECTCKPGQDNKCGRRFDGNYDHKFVYSNLGFNLKITDWQARNGIYCITMADDIVNARKYNVGYMRSKLEKYTGKIYFPRQYVHADPSWFGMVIYKENAKEFQKKLEDKGVPTRPMFAGNILRQPYIKKYMSQVSQHGMMRNTDWLMNNAFYIGCHIDFDCDKAVSVIEEVLNESNSDTSENK